MAQEMDAASGRLAQPAHRAGGNGQAQDVVAGAHPTTRRPALALTAEGQRRADLIVGLRSELSARSPAATLKLESLRSSGCRAASVRSQSSYGIESPT